MSRYIDADELIKTITSTNFTTAGANDILAICCKIVVDNAPTADVVEVVRCKDCKHYKRNIPCVGGYYNGCDEWIDEGNAITVYDNDYCSYGERADA